MKIFLLAILMFFCGAFLVACDSEEGPAAPGGTEALPTLSADESSDPSTDVEQAADQMVQDAEGEFNELEQMADQAADEVVTQAKALTDEVESAVSGLEDAVPDTPVLDASGQSLQEFLSSAAKKLDEHKSQIATLKSLGDKFGNVDLNQLITAASDKLTEAQDLYKQMKTVTDAGDLKAQMAQLTDVLGQVGQLSRQALDKVESLKQAAGGTEIPWK